ncbi:MAG: hypothetical protein HZA89_04810 [Verrucomicrobia bacterium]|nr:hypothetical protein [Verrucomicrobiota bacterium]
MKTVRTLASLALALLSAVLVAQESGPAKVPQGDVWIKNLTDRAKRDALSDHRESVRGDSGRWNDAPRLQHAPPIQRKPPKVSLDDWADQLAERKFQPTSADDNWLVFRSRQLDDNDRVWVERIERRGNEFVVVLNEAIWQGYYQKTFTYYPVLGVNLGKLAPGNYKAKCVIQPMQFKRFEEPGRPQDNWPKDEQPAGKKPVELSVAFTVVAAR